MCLFDCEEVQCPVKCVLESLPWPTLAVYLVTIRVLRHILMGDRPVNYDLQKEIN